MYTFELITFLLYNIVAQIWVGEGYLQYNATVIQFWKKVDKDLWNVVVQINRTMHRSRDSETKSHPLIHPL